VRPLVRQQKNDFFYGNLDIPNNIELPDIVAD
jgi:hypothetical protein